MKGATRTEGVPGLGDVQEEVVCGRRAERPVVGEPDGLQRIGFENDGGPWREDPLVNVVVVVVPGGRYQRQILVKGALALHVDPEFVDIVAGFIGTGDGTTCIRAREQGVDPVGNQVTVFQAKAMLGLQDRKGGLVHDERVCPQEFGIPGVAAVVKGLNEYVLEKQATLEGVIGPSVCLTSADTRHFDTVDPRKAGGKDPREILAGTNVESQFPADAAHIVVSGIPAAQPHLLRVFVFPVRSGKVLAGQFDADLFG